MNGTKILLVEDDPGHQHLIAELLALAQRQVELEVVSSGREAVRAIQNRLFDCVLLDFNLPDTRADELLRVLAKDERLPPVIVISSSRDQDTAIKSLRSGCIDFLPKMEAINSDKLWHRVEAALHKRRDVRAEHRKLERRMHQLEHLADKDPLTGLSNRRCLDRLFEERRITSDRRGLASVIMLDLDHFKSINDRHGHDCGDRVLRTVADTLRNCARRKDVVCRYGGEEFLIIKPGTSHAVAVHWAEMLREKIAQLEIRSGDRRVPATVSIGVVNCASGTLGPQMVSRSDAAMYLAKQRGRNMVCSWQMVLFHEAAHRVASPSGQSVEERHRDVLMQTRQHLGRTQWQHLTTHSQYVSKLAVRLGKALGLDEATLERLHVAGLCHDLGKFLIPEEVLAKPGALSEEEWALLARHSADGAEMSLILGADPVAADYIRSHHVRCDGPGTADSPDHPIPQGARIVGIADALVAMTSYRSYQPPRSFTGAMRELQRESGGQFDPEIVAAVPRALLSDLVILQSTADR
jgi:diguanylate cyclase (GGDEF)-like protein